MISTPAVAAEMPVLARIPSSTSATLDIAGLRFTLTSSSATMMKMRDFSEIAGSLAASDDAGGAAARRAVSCLLRSGWTIRFSFESGEPATRAAKSRGVLILADSQG